MQADQKHIQNLTQADILLAKITKHVKSELHYKLHTPDRTINWGDTGTSGRTLELVKEIAEFLNIEGDS